MAGPAFVTVSGTKALGILSVPSQAALPSACSARTCRQPAPSSGRPSHHGCQDSLLAGCPAALGQRSRASPAAKGHVRDPGRRGGPRPAEALALFPHCRVLAPWPLPRVPPHQGLQGSSGAVRAECKKAASLTGARRREAQQKYQMRGTNLSGFETGRVTMRHQAGPRFVWTLVRHSRRWTKQTEH